MFSDQNLDKATSALDLFEHVHQTENSENDDEVQPFTFFLEEQSDNEFKKEDGDMYEMAVRKYLCELLQTKSDEEVLSVISFYQNFDEFHDDNKIIIVR